MKERKMSTWTNDYFMNLVKEKPGKTTFSLKTLRCVITTQRLEDTSHRLVKGCKHIEKYIIT
jgi:hypothetical protein